MWLSAVFVILLPECVNSFLSHLNGREMGSHHFLSKTQTFSSHYFLSCLKWVFVTFYLKNKDRHFHNIAFCDSCVERDQFSSPFHNSVSLFHNTSITQLAGKINRIKEKKFNLQVVYTAVGYFVLLLSLSHMPSKFVKFVFVLWFVEFFGGSWMGKYLWALHDMPSCGVGLDFQVLKTVKRKKNNKNIKSNFSM